MKNALRIALVAAALAAPALPAAAQEFRILLADTFESIVKGQTGKRVTLKLRSGQEVTGTVAVVVGRMVHLKALAGRELFDAVIPIEAVDAVIVRAKE